MRSKSKRLVALAMVATLGFAATACGSDDDGDAGGDTTAPGGSGKCEAGTPTSTPLPKNTADGKGKTIGLLFDVTGRGDKSFNDSAAAGLDKAKTDFGVAGVESTPEATDGSDRPDRIKQVAGGPSTLIIGVGFLWATGVKDSAAANASKMYGIIDEAVLDNNGTPDNAADDKPLKNVRSMVFAEEQGSYLVGVAAACASKSGKLGFIGGVQTPLIQKFEAGFIAGVKSIKADATIDVKYLTQIPDFTGFNDPTKGKATAAAMYGAGIDVVYHAAGGSGKGLFEAAAETKKQGQVWAIGVDSDQYNAVDATQKPYILTSMLKRVDLATYSAITDFVNGKYTTDLIRYDLSVDGVGYATSGGFIDDIVPQLEEAKAAIISGAITVPTDPAEA